MKTSLLFVAAIAQLLSLAAVLPASADEYIRTAEELYAEGFQPVIWAEATDHPHELPFPAHSQGWPVEFADSDHALGNVMAQFQPFDNPPYFHAGVDIRTTTDSPVRAQVSGWLEAGHYGYATRPDGSMQKFWKPWPQKGDATYFEVSIVTADGLRYEHHHMNRDRLPSEIVAMLNHGKSWVEKGTLLGYPIPFSWDYDHIHYNIIFPDGTRANPEYAATLVPDHKAPQVLAALSVTSSGETESLDAPLTRRPSEFVIACFDELDRGPYQHPPTRARLLFANGASTVWDFTQTLTDSSGAFPNLHEVFKDEIETPDGKALETSGGYGTGTSLIRLKVPKQASGEFRIELSDQAGNVTKLNGKLP